YLSGARVLQVGHSATAERRIGFSPKTYPASRSPAPQKAISIRILGFSAPNRDPPPHRVRLVRTRDRRGPARTCGLDLAERGPDHPGLLARGHDRHGEPGIQRR